MPSHCSSQQFPLLLILFSIFGKHAVEEHDIAQNIDVRAVDVVPSLPCLKLHLIGTASAVVLLFQP